jgi:hypothetical protein
VPIEQPALDRTFELSVNLPPLPSIMAASSRSMRLARVRRKRARSEPSRSDAEARGAALREPSAIAGR